MLTKGISRRAPLESMPSRAICANSFSRSTTSGGSPRSPYPSAIAALDLAVLAAFPNHGYGFVLLDTVTVPGPGPHQFLVRSINVVVRVHVLIELREGLKRVAGGCCGDIDSRFV